jgi:enamine deaminase RidA (YjgF/YER057c/UK114 family)
MKRTVMADKGPAPAGPYSHAVVANGFVFVSGQGAVNPEAAICRMLSRTRFSRSASGE